ncbi:MAG: KpsF/GutQ family sugar-phosphate isomerase [Gammaproteobacteria bacterium]|nr:KpsF/GutQ family sugar-phosphate isomerase [Gammaproteobacteria bacterium]
MTRKSQPSSEERKKFCNLGLAVIRNEAAAVQKLTDRINEEFATACHYLLQCEGRIVVTGMGKSGHICGKIAATLASTGSPAFFVHPGEASHGDLGMITTKDVVLALSNSGETSELLTIIPIIKRLGVPLISMTGNPASNLARESDVHIDVSVEQEACPLNLAPTSSTTASLVMGDALAVALLEARGFTESDFARSHPGGALGRRLLLHIKDIMHTGDEIPAVPRDAYLRDALVEMTNKGLGMTAIVGTDGRLEGVYTDGDLRRTLDREIDIRRSLVSEFMTRRCKTASGEMLAVEALKIMQDNKINALLIVAEDGRLTGALNMHDLLRAGVV